VNEAIEVCTEVIRADEGNQDALCDRADAYILNERFDDAMHDFKRASEINGESRRAHDGQQLVQKLLKQAKRRDYYKILGVPRNANKKQIVKAYRLLAQQWHPDNFQEGNEKKAAEAKFIDIASAKEVLSDPEKRARFDQGEDPLDPESQQGQGFNPFQQGFNPFGGGFGGGGFKFNFG